MQNSAQNILSRRGFIAGSAAIAAGAAVAGRLLAADQAWAASSTADAGASASAATDADGLVEVVDLEGTSVAVPPADELDSIVITSYKGAFPAALILGQLDKVTGMASTERYLWLNKAFPQIADIHNFGSFDDVSVEEILQADVDVVIAPARCADTTAKMRELGIAVAVDGTGGAIDADATAGDFERILEDTIGEMNLVAALTGTEDVAQKYYTWAMDLLNMVDARVADIPDDQRVRVLPVRNNILQVFDSNYICGKVVELAGGINVSRGCADGTGTFFADVDAEKIVEWNPDMLFIINFNAGLDEENDLYEEWASDERYAGVTGFANGDVYLVPTTLEQWDASSQAPLGVVWMAKIMYPDLFEDVDPKQICEDFYKEFMGYEITEDDWQLIAPQYTGANSNGLID